MVEFQSLIYVNSIKYNILPIFNDAIGQTAQVGFENDPSTNQRVRPYVIIYTWIAYESFSKPVPGFYKIQYPIHTFIANRRRIEGFKRVYISSIMLLCEIT